MSSDNIDHEENQTEGTTRVRRNSTLRASLHLNRDERSEEKPTFTNTFSNNVYRSVRVIPIAFVLVVCAVAAARAGVFGRWYNFSNYLVDADDEEEVEEENDPTNCACSASSSGLHKRSSWTTTVLLVVLVVREIVRLMPVWAKPWTKKHKRIHGRMADMSSIWTKLQALLHLFQNHVRAHMPLSVFWWALLTKFKIMQQIKRRAPHLRDSMFRKAGRAVKLPDEMEEHVKFAKWAYESMAIEWTWDNLGDALESCGYELIRHITYEAPGCACHYIAMNFEKKEAIISIKGTSSITDIITDVCGTAVPYILPNAPITEGGDTEIYVHEGMMYAAEHLGHDIKHTVKEMMFSSGFRVRIVGHSLGAGIAVLLGIYLRSCFPETRGTDQLQVYAYATPPVTDKKTAMGCSDFIQSAVNDSDFVPRLSVGNLFTALQFYVKFMTRLDERKQSPKGLFATMRWLHMMIFQKDMIISPSEYDTWVKSALNVDDPMEYCHLYVPGKIYLMYGDWAGKSATKINHVVECNGTCDALRIMEFDFSMLWSHIDYYTPLRVAKALPIPVQDLAPQERRRRRSILSRYSFALSSRNLMADYGEDDDSTRSMDLKSVLAQPEFRRFLSEMEEVDEEDEKKQS